MKIIHENITDFFDEAFNDLHCHKTTRNYILGIFEKYKISNDDLSKDSVSLIFLQAQNKKDFSMYQNLGNWLFFTKTMFPQSLQHAPEDYYDSIAQLSYYNCYRIVRSWKLYEELADKYILLTKEVRNKLKNKIMI